MKQIIITIIAVVAIIGGAVLLSGGNEDETASQPSNNFYGQENGIITVSEYGDFQCPACAGFFPVVSQVKEAFKDQIRFEYVHFPLVQIHPNATAAHRAAQAAANQGKFWEMHDVLYQRLQSWSDSTNPSSIFEEYAREIGLDMDQYSNEVNTSDILGVINADIERGKNLGVNSTPSFFIDGEAIDDLSSLSTVEGFSQVIQDAIDAKTGNNTEEQEATVDQLESVEARPEETPAE